MKTIVVLVALVLLGFVCLACDGADGPPPVVEEARQDLAQRLGVSAAAIRVDSFERVDWPDSCLGLAAADEFCAQVITPGYSVVLEHAGESYRYRTGLESAVRLEP